MTQRSVHVEEQSKTSEGFADNGGSSELLGARNSQN